MDRMENMDEIVQSLREHGIVDFNANAPGMQTGGSHGKVTIEMVWALYNKVSGELAVTRDAHAKQVKELERYVQNVRQLSEERDRLTAEFDNENKSLKEELDKMKKSQMEEEKSIIEMCHDEKIPELIGNSRTEQVAYLMLVRSNLLEKLAVTEKDLRSEDSELRNRMELAMAEMGGMANKLTEAVQERDRLKREVAQLNKTLSLVNNLPSNNVNNMEAKTQIMALENSVNYYVGQIERLTSELDKTKTQGRIKEAELAAELREYKDMNAKQKGVNTDQDPRLSPGHPTGKRSYSVDSHLLPETQEELQAKSKQLITDMEAVLQSESKLAEERDKRHQEEISRLQNRITVLEEAKDNKESGISAVEYQELKAQLAEIDRQYKVAKAEEAETKEKFHKLQREMAKVEASYKQTERQLNTQSEISYGLKQRNDELELELAKTLNEVQSSNEKQNKLLADRRQVEHGMTQKERHINDLMEQISELKLEHNKEIRELKLAKDESTKLKSYASSESKRVSDLQIQLNEAQTRLEVEKGKRFSAEEQLETAELDFESAIRKKEELSRELDDANMKCESLEHRLQMMSGKYEDIQGEKMVEELSRGQLEDVANVMRIRLMSSLDKSHGYAEKYLSLKQKHKAKLRQIRDLLMMERKTTADEVEKLELRVTLAESALEQELSWKQKAIDDVKKAEEEQRKAIQREDDARKDAEQRNTELHEALSKYRNLSDENKMLQSQLEHLESQKEEIEKLVSKEHQKKELNTLLSELSLSGSLPKTLVKKLPSTTALDESGYNESPTIEFDASSENLPKIASKQ